MRKITDPDIKDAIAVIEGDQWQYFDAEEEKKNNGQSVNDALKQWRNWRLNDTEEALKLGESSIHEDNDMNNIIIYGFLGYNRYYVLWSGEVVFSKSHATPNRDLPHAGIKSAITKAKEAGFRIW